MIDILVIFTLLVFLFWGFREGLVKALGSIVMVFLALFGATAFLQFLAKNSAYFTDPTSASAVVAFFAAWLVSFFILDLLLGLVLSKVIRIIVLGLLDRVAGVVLGGLKGLLVAGIILQLLLCLPLASERKKQMLDSTLCKISIATYQRAYPMAQKWAPYFNDFLKENLIEKMQMQKKIPELVSAEAEKIKQMTPDEVMNKIIEYERIKKEQERKIRELLEQHKIQPSVPQGSAR